MRLLGEIILNERRKCLITETWGSDALKGWKEANEVLNMSGKKEDMKMDSQEGITVKPREAKGREESFIKVSVVYRVWCLGEMKCKDGVESNGYQKQL